MAVKSYRVDDLDKKTTEGVQTVAFSFEGKAYEIDLSEKNRAEFADVMSTYVKVAEPVSAPRTARSTSTVNTAAREDSRAARAWAQGAGEKTVKDAGVKVPGDRGRVDSRIIDLWEKAGKPSA